MIHVLTATTVILGFVSLAFTLPQAIQLHKCKDSRNFNLVTWTTWLIYQSFAIVYSVDIHAFPFAIISGCWIIMYIWIVSMIIRYRKPVAKTSATDFLPPKSPA